MWGLLVPGSTQNPATFMCAQGTWQGQTACRISASYLYVSCSYAKCGVWGDMVDVVTCAIFGRLMGVGVVRGVSLPSPIDLTYNTDHTTV